MQMNALGPAQRITIDFSPPIFAIASKVQLANHSVGGMKNTRGWWCMPE